jgi:hypothetical protein
LKVVPQASNCREIEVGGRIYKTGRNGLFDMPEREARYTIKYEGGQAAALSGTTTSHLGRRCQDCGFGSFFTTCSRCGGQCVREGASVLHHEPSPDLVCRCPGGIHSHA